MSPTYNLVLDRAPGKSAVYTLAPLVKNSVGTPNQRSFQDEAEFYQTLATAGIDPGSMAKQILSRGSRAISISTSEQALVQLGVWVPSSEAAA